MYAAERSDNDGLVEDLLNAGADVNAVSADGYTALYPVAMAGNDRTAAILRKWGADPDRARVHGIPTIVYAASRDNSAAIRVLTACGADPNAARSDGRTALVEAASAGAVEAARALICAGADPNRATARGRTPLMFACALGGAAIVRELLAARADPNIATLSSKRTALGIAVAACRHGSAGRDECPKEMRTIVRMLLDAGAQPGAARSDGVTPLMLAARNGCVRLAKLLIAGGGSSGLLVSQQASNGWTALHFAASSTRARMIRVLVDAGADVNRASVSQKTPIVLAIESCARRLDAVMQTKDAPGPVPVSAPGRGIPTEDEQPPVEDEPDSEINEAPASARCGGCRCASTVRALLEARGTPNRATVHGLTPLLLASANIEHAAVVEMLLDHGACAIHVSGGGLSAPMIACARKNGPVLLSLLQRLPHALLELKAPVFAKWMDTPPGTPTPSLKEAREMTKTLRDNPDCHSPACPSATHLRRDKSQSLGQPEKQQPQRAQDDGFELPRIPTQPGKKEHPANSAAVRLVDRRSQAQTLQQQQQQQQQQGAQQLGHGRRDRFPQIN
eukprot:m51a1_g9203 hypothetical protein (564) ;mRNA; r:116195-117886